MEQPLGSDWLIAGNTIAVVAAVDPFQRAVDPLDLLSPPTLLFQGHSLDLHGIHSAETTHALLIQLDGLAALGSALAQIQKLSFQRLQSRFHCFKVYVQIVVHGKKTTEAVQPCQPLSAL